VQLFFVCSLSLATFPGVTWMMVSTRNNPNFSLSRLVNCNNDWGRISIYCKLVIPPTTTKTTRKTFYHHYRSSKIISHNLRLCPFTVNLPRFGPVTNHYHSWSTIQPSSGASTSVRTAPLLSPKCQRQKMGSWHGMTRLRHRGHNLA